MNHASRIFVVVVNFNSADYVKACVGSLTAPEIISITVVDNDSADGDIAKLRDLEASNVRLNVIRSNTNLGFAGGVNLGVRSSGADPESLIWILNPDTVVGESAARLLAKVIVDGSGGIVSPLILTGRGRDERVWFAGGDLDMAKGVSWHWGAGRLKSKLPSSQVESPFITGAAPMMSKRSWDALGGLSEDYFLYWEDADLSLRARELGMRMTIAPEAKIWHEQGGSTGQEGGGNSPGYYYYGQRNRILVCSRGASRLQLVLGSGFRETARLLVQPFFRDTSPRGKKLAASLRGIFDGLHDVRGRGPY